jgi:hypothetical protein
MTRIKVKIPEALDVDDRLLADNFRAALQGQQPLYVSDCRSLSAARKSLRQVPQKLGAVVERCPEDVLDGERLEEWSRIQNNHRLQEVLMEAFVRAPGPPEDVPTVCKALRGARL